MEIRQEKLRTLLENENEQFEHEIEEKSRPRSRLHSADVLEQIKQSKVETEELKRRQELEKNLYQRWRFGMDRDQILLDSKSENHALAKLNWLDRQVEMQIQNNEERKQQQEYEMRLQQEARKHEAFVTKRNEMRECEIKELRAMQESHVNELKVREHENDEIKTKETCLKKRKSEIQEELENLRQSYTQRKDRAIALHNLRRIKMLLRERAEQVRRDLKQDIAVLDKIGLEWADSQSICYLRNKFQMQYDLEIQKQTYIEAMYESEAKQCLVKQEKVWMEESQLREQQIRTLLEDCIAELDKEIDTCVHRVRDLIGIRETHLNAIENTNHRLKALLECTFDEKPIIESKLDNKIVTASIKNNNISRSRPSTAVNRIIQPDIDDDDDFYRKFRRINEDFMSPSPRSDSPLKIPEFGRKKIAWF